MPVNLQRFFSKFPLILLKDYKLRDIMLSDRREYYDMMSNEEVHKYLSEQDVPSSIEEAENEIKFWSSLFYRKQSVFWAIAQESDDKMIGTIGYNSWVNQSGRAEIAYDLSREYWGKGIASKCVSRALRFGFEEMDLYRIEARSMKGNALSHKLLTRLGFKEEGILRQYRPIRGVREDIVLHSLIREEFNEVE